MSVLQNLEDRLILEEKHTEANRNIARYEISTRTIVLTKNGERMIVGVATDITERKNAEAELDWAQQFLRNVIDNRPNLIFVKDPEGRFTLANRSLAKLYGTTAEKLIGKTDGDFGRPLDEVERIRSDE